MNGRRPHRRQLPSPINRNLLRVRGIERGDEILDRQMVPQPVHFEATPMGRFGGGTTSIKTNHTIHFRDHGKVAVWESDGYIKISEEDFVTEAPDDGQPYVRINNSWELLSVAVGAVTEAPNTGLNYVRNGLLQQWEPLPFILPIAPNDGQAYAWNELQMAWQPVFTETQASALFAPITTVSFPEAPADGQSYARRGIDHSWQPVITDVSDIDLDGGVY